MAFSAMGAGAPGAYPVAGVVLIHRSIPENSATANVNQPSIAALNHSYDPHFQRVAAAQERYLLMEPISESTTNEGRDHVTTGRFTEKWTTLVGQRVQIKNFNGVIDAGLVEAVTPDGSILWLEPEGAILRRLVQKLPGIELRLIDTA